MEVLAVLHARGEADARAIREALERYRPMSHASVLTLLGRLEAKSLVQRRKGEVGKAFVYSAAKSPRPTLGHGPKPDEGQDRENDRENGR